MSDNTSAGVLILLRHGESTANADDRFGGWRDYPLTEQGRREAADAATVLAKAGLVPEAVHTSVLRRAVDTADLVLEAMSVADVVPQRSWRLNERHYGKLQGRSRADARREFGAEPVATWRRSYDAVPPPVAVADPDHPRNDARYADLPAHELPASESLADVRRRLVPYWRQSVCRDLRAGRVTLVVAHGNSLRALCMHLDSASADEIRAAEVPTGIPLRFDLDDDLTPLVRGGRYLSSTGVGRPIGYSTPAPAD